MSFYGKEYQLDRQENFEAFIDSLGPGLPQEIKDIVINHKPVTKLEKDGDTYTLTSTKPDDTTSVVTFKLGEEIEETVYGRNAKSVFSLEDNVLTQVQTFEEGTLTFVREFSDDEIVSTTTASNWDGKTVRYYKAL